MHSLTDAVVIFDLDGTFADTAADLCAALNYVLVLAGRPPVPLSRVRHLVGYGARAMLRRGFLHAGETVPEAALDAHVSTFLSYYVENIAVESRPFPFVLDSIDELRESGAKLAICTNKREGPARLLLRTLGVESLFSVIVGMDTTAAAKPDPRPVRFCMDVADRRLAVMIGDSDTDVAAAIAAGIPSMVFAGGYGPISMLGHSNGFFGDYRGLAALVRRALN